MLLGALAALALVVLLPGRAAAATHVVTFEDLTGGTRIQDQYAAQDLTFPPKANPDDPDPRPFITTLTPGMAHSGTNVAQIPIPPSCEFCQPLLIGQLPNSARSVSMYVGNVDTATEEVTLTALNSSGQPIGTPAAVTTPGGALTQQLTVTTTSPVADIAGFELTGPSSSNANVVFDDVTITTDDAPSPPDIGVRIGTNPVNVPVGDSVDVPIVIQRLNGSSGNVALAVSGLPTGVTASFSPNPVTGTSTTATMKLTAGDLAPATADYATMTVTATPGAGAGSDARTATALTRVVENCTHSLRLPYLDVRAQGCLHSFGPGKYEITNQDINVDGLILAPLGGDRTIEIDTSKRTISSRGDPVGVSVAGAPELQLYGGPLNWDLADKPTPPGGQSTLHKDKTVVDIDISSVALLKGIPVTHDVVALTEAGKAKVTPTFTLGFWPFDYFGSITATSTFTTDNDHGPDFSGLEIKADHIAAVGVELKDVDVKWSEGGNWSGKAKLVLRFANAYTVGAGFGLKDGGFDYLQGSVDDLNVSVGPGVFLQKIGFEVHRNPLSLAGTVGFSGGPSLAGKKAVTVEGTFKATFDDPWVIEVDGTAKVADKFKLGDAFVRYSSTGLFQLGGKVSWDLKVGSVNGQVSGFVDGLRAADLEGSVRGCIYVPVFPDPCAGAGFLVSNIGIAACVDLTVVSGGIGYYWGGDFDLFSGCDLSPWRPTTSSLRAGPRRFTLARNLPSAAFAVDGTGGPPGITVSGPHGQAVTVSKVNPYVRNGDILAVMSEAGTTYVYLRKPEAGVWTITDDGTVPVKDVREALGLPSPSVKATVTGKGRRRALHWRLKPIAGQTVRFAETGRDVRHVLGTVRAKRGTLPFRPADGPAGKRKIVALVLSSGLPRRTLTLASYRAPGMPRPDKPRGVRIVRHGKRLSVHWRRDVHAGYRHIVYGVLGDGRRLELIAGAGKRSVALPRMPARFAAAVRVAGLTQANGRGPSTRATLPGAAPSRPAKGAWKIADPFGYTKRGGFTVAKGGRSFTSLAVTPGSGARQACGTARVRLTGRHTLARVSHDGIRSWATARRAPKASDGLGTVKVKATRGGKRRAARLKLVFTGRRTAVGELDLTGCKLYFGAKR